MEIKRIIDHHCHGVTTDDLDRAAFEALISESHLPPPDGCSNFDKPVGLMVRRHCCPILDLDPFSSAQQYMDRRLELGGQVASERLMRAAGMDGLMIDTGHRADYIADVPTMATLAHCDAREVVRIETVLETSAMKASTGKELLIMFRTALEELSVEAVALKSVVAYRATFDIDQSIPTENESVDSANSWLKQIEKDGWQRLSDPILLRYALFCALDVCADQRFPLQLHVGVGDCDIVMPKCDPTVFIPFVMEAEAKQIPITLLHCYPFIKESTWMAEVFQNVYYDVGFTLNFTGALALRTMQDAMEMGPFFKHLYSSDAFGLAELHHLGRIQFERMLDAVISDWISSGDINHKDAEKIIHMITHKNTERIYRYKTPRSSSSPI